MTYTQILYWYFSNRQCEAKKTNTQDVSHFDKDVQDASEMQVFFVTAAPLPQQQ